MGARETLLRRMEHAGTTAVVSCGALGEMTVEGLPLRDMISLSRKADGDRALLFAACRELQELGEELRVQKRLFRPEEIMAYISDKEAADAASLIRQMSGWEDVAAADAVVESAAQEELLPAELPESPAGEVAIPPSQPAISAEEFSSQPAAPVAAAVSTEHHTVFAATPRMPAAAAEAAPLSTAKEMPSSGSTGMFFSPESKRSGRLPAKENPVSAAQAEQIARFLLDGLRRAKQVR